MEEHPEPTLRAGPLRRVRVVPDGGAAPEAADLMHDHHSTRGPDRATAGRPRGTPARPGDELRDLGRIRRTTGPDRKVAGVAGGLARHLDIDPVILRVAFVVLVFFGGAGLLLYGACWLLVPEDGAASAALGLDDRNRSVALVVVGGISRPARCSATRSASSASRGRWR